MLYYSASEIDAMLNKEQDEAVVIETYRSILVDMQIMVHKLEDDVAIYEEIREELFEKYNIDADDFEGLKL